MKSSREMKDKELFDKISSKYIKKDIISYSRQSRKLRLLRSLKNIVKPIDTILELGCGAGFSADYLDGSYNQFTGLDYSSELICYATDHNGSDHAHFLCQNLKNYKCSTKYSVVMMVGVLHHVTEIEEVLQNIKLFLNKDGVLVVNEPQKGNPIVGILRTIRKMIDSNYSDDQIYFTEQQLLDLFSKSGYDVKSFSQGIFSTPLAETNFLPSFIGFPLSLLFSFIDPFLESLLFGQLRKISWNIVVEARLKK